MLQHKPPSEQRGRVTRIAVLNSHPIQYFAPLYAYLNSAPDLEITALYMSDVSVRGGRDADFAREIKWDVDLLSGYRSVFLGSRSRTREPGGFWSLFAPELWRELRSGRYDVLWLHGHSYAANLLALTAAKTCGLHVLMRGETHLGLPRGKFKSLFRRPLMACLYGMCDRLLAIGTANAEFYRAMGVSDHKIFIVPYSVDNERFARAANLTAAQRSELRQQYGLPTGLPLIIYAAKFTERKRPLDLLEAVARLRRKGVSPFAVAMVGSGELEAELRSFCAHHLLDNVVFPGFINQSELPRWYAASDVFVLPSESEPWGLAVNEAMCAGLPVVVSREIGCVPDLVESGVNGYVPAGGDVDALASALQVLIEDERLRLKLGNASRSRISRWGYRECLAGLRSALSKLEYDDKHSLQADSC
jgi:glycosyltransferase involved in cell wall biosynthesis